MAVMCRGETYEGLAAAEWAGLFRGHPPARHVLQLLENGQRPLQRRVARGAL
jgi:hypothetical protein